MILKLNEKQVEKIKNWIEFIEDTYKEETVNEMKSELLNLLLSNPTIYKDTKKSEAELFLYESGLYKELKIAKNKYLRNERYKRKDDEE